MSEDFKKGNLKETGSNEENDPRNRASWILTTAAKAIHKNDPPKNLKDRLHFFKIKNSCSEKDTINTEWKNKGCDWEKNLQITCSTKDLYFFVKKKKKNPSKTKQRKETTQLKMGKRLEQTLHQKEHANGYK